MKFRLLSCFVASVFATLASAQLYSVTDLGTLGSSNSNAFAINNSGQIVGGSGTSSGYSHAFYWSAGTMTDITPTAGSANAIGINASGTVIGAGNFGAGTRAYTWSAGTLTLLGTPSTGSVATAINDSGVVAGIYSDYTGVYPCTYQSGTITNLLGTGTSDDWPSAINNDGVVSSYNSTTKEVVIFKGGTRTVIETMGNYAYAAVYGMNSVGQIAYFRGLPGPGYTSINHYYKWTPDVPSGTTGKFREFTSLIPTGGAAATPYAVNAYGDVVGDYNSGCFIIKEGVFYDLTTVMDPTPGWTMTDARAVNDKGQIVGTGRKTISGVTYYHALLLTPL